MIKKNDGYKGNLSMEIQKIGQIGVPVQDLERAIQFYKNKLGLPHLFTAGKQWNSASSEPS
jgi:catechol-2,3-dioxygenase